MTELGMSGLSLAFLFLITLAFMGLVYILTMILFNGPKVKPKNKRLKKKKSFLKLDSIKEENFTPYTLDRTYSTHSDIVDILNLKFCLNYIFDFCFLKKVYYPGLRDYVEESMIEYRLPLEVS